MTAWGTNVERFPAGYDRDAEHDHAGDGQEEVYVPLSGSAVLIVELRSAPLLPSVPGVLAGDPGRIETRL